MSTQGGAKGQQEQRGDRATECPVCFETYEAPPSQLAPVSLPCGHTFCREHAASDTGQADQVDGGALQICCPTCRQHSPMPEGGAAGLPVNYALVAVVQEQQARGGAAAAAAPAAHTCNWGSGGCDDGSAATHHCAECAEFLCAECHAAHSRSRGMRAHAVRSVIELAAGGGPPPPPAFCGAHPGEPLKLWCETCAKLICRDCIVVEHREHVFDFLPSMLEKHRPGIEAALAEVDARLPPIAAAVTAIAQLEETLTLRRDVLCADVQRRGSAIKAAVDRRVEELVAECCALSDTKEKQLVMQREGLMGSLEGMRAGCDFARRTLERAALEPDQVLLAEAQLTADLRRMRAQPLELGPVETARLEFLDTRPALAADAAAFGGVTGSVTLAANCTAEGDGLSAAMAGAEASFTVRAVDFRGEARTEGGDAVAVSLERAAGGGGGAAAAGADECKDGGGSGGGEDEEEDAVAAVVDVGDGTYRCAYTAGAEGRAALHVRVLGAPIRGSPFAVEVAPAGVVCRFERAEGSAFDTGGVLYHLGTAGGACAYANPHGGAAGVVVSLSSVGGDGSEPKRFVQHDHGGDVYNHTAHTPDSWMAVDLGAAHRLVPDHYALRATLYNDGTHKPRHWVLEGSVDSAAWSVLRAHANDSSCNRKMGVAAWALDGAAVGGRAFRHFRVRQTGKCSSGHDHLMCAGIELYGRLATIE